MAVSLIPQNYDGVARSQVPAGAPQYSGISQAAVPQGFDQRQQWLENRAAYFRAQAQQAQQAQLAQQQQAQLTPQAYQMQGLNDRYTQQNPGTIASPDPKQLTRSMNPLEQGIAFLGNDVSDVVGSYSGWDPNKGFTPENIAAFVAGLPGQMASGMLQAPANFASGITGNQYLDNPYTEQLEVDTEHGTITTETLDGAQRAASIVNGIINTGLTGASGQVLRSISPWFKTVGAFGRTVFNGASKPAQVGLSMARGTAVEAGEEFTQSYLDDITFSHLGDDSFDRAVEASKWGALGGGIMSGAGQGIAYVRGKIRNEQRIDQNNADQGDGNTGGPDQIRDVSEYYEHLQNSGGMFDHMPNMTNAVKESILNHYVSRTPGSMILKHARTFTNQKRMDEISVSDENIVDTYERSTNDGQADILNAFGATKAEFDNAVYNRRITHADGTVETFATRAEAMTALIREKKPYGVKVALMRSPDTKNGGFYVNITEVTQGGDLQVHAAVYSLFGADVDGDTSVLLFNPDKANVGGYASEIGINQEGRSNFDENFLNIRYGLKEDDVKNLVRQSIPAQYSLSNSTIDHISKTFMEGYNEKNKFSSAMNSLLLAARDAARSAGATNDDASRIGRNAYCDFLMKASDTTQGSYRDTWASRTAMVIDEEIRRGEIDDIKTWENIESNLKSINARGTLGDGTLPVDIFDFIGFVTYVLTTKGNIIFRQYGEAGFTAKTVDAYMNALEQAESLTGNKSVFQSLIRASFRMVTEGVSPKSATEGMFQSYVITRTLGRWGKSNKIRTRHDVEEFLGIFKEAYNDGVLMYNQAMEQMSTEGLALPFDAIRKTELTGIDDVSIGRQFGKVFASMPIDMLFDNLDHSSRIHDNMTFEQFLEMISREGGLRTYTEALTFGDEGVQGFVDKLVSGWKSDKKVVSNKVKTFLSELKLSKLRKIWENGKRMDPDFKFSDLEHRQFQVITDAIGLVIDPEVAFESGVFGEEILNTRLGRMLFSDKTDDRFNAVAGIVLNHTFRPLMNLLASDNAETRAGALMLIQEKAEISDIHRVISAQLQDTYANEGTAYSKLLDFLTDPDQSWEKKEGQWNKLDLCSGITAATDDLFFDCLMTQTSNFDISGMSERLRKADSAKNNYEKLMYDRAYEEVENLENLWKTSQNKVSLVGFFNYLVNNLRMTVDIDVLGAKTFASAVLVNKQMEKGTNEDAGTISYQMLEQLVNGAMVPYMNQIAGENNGVLTMQNFANNRLVLLKLLSDRDFKVDVYDIASDSYVTMSFDVLMSDVVSGWDSNTKLTNEHVIQLFKKYPMLADMLSDVKATATQGDANVGSVLGKAMPLTEAYNAYSRGTSGLFFGDEDTLVTLEEELRMQEISNVLMNWSDYTGYLVRAAGDAIESTSSMKAINDEIKSTHYKFVRGIHALMLEHPNGLNAESIIKNYFSSLIDREISEINGMFFAASNEVTSMFDGTQLGKNLQVMVGDAAMLAAKKGPLDAKLSSNGFDVSAVNVQYGTLSQSLDAEVEQIKGAVNTKIDSALRTARQMYTALYHMWGKAFEVSGLGELNSGDVRNEYVGQAYKQAAAQFGIDADRLEKYMNGEITPNPNERSSFDSAKNIASQWIADIDTSLSGPIDIRQIIDIPFLESHDFITLADIRELYNMCNSGISTNSFEFRARFNNLVSKAVRLVTKSERPVDPKAVTKEFKEALDEMIKLSEKPDTTDSDRIRPFVQLMSVYDGGIFDTMLKDIRGTIGTEFNVNMVTDMSDTIDSLNRLFCYLPTKLPRLDTTTPFVTKRNERRSIDYELPKMKFTSQRRQAMVSSLKMVERGSRASTQVGVNGSQTKMYTGFGFLSPRWNEGAPSRTENGDFILNFTEYETGKGVNKHKENTDSWACTLVPEGQELTGRDVITMRQMRKKIQDDPTLRNAPIRFWHPDDNAHGIYDLCSPLPSERTVRKYNRLGSIIGMLQDDAQEALVLKAKKQFLSNSDLIVDEREIGDPDKYHLDADKLQNAAMAFKNMRSYLLETRRGYANTLLQVFKDNHKSNNLGYDAARIISQALTPAYKLRFRNGDAIFIDVEHLFKNDDQDFTRVWNDMIARHGEIVTASVKFATPEEISARIMRSVVKVPEADFGNRTIVNRAAAEGVMSWDNRSANNLSVSRIMANVDPLGYSYSNGIIAENTSTPVQSMVNAMFGGRIGSTVQSSYRLGSSSNLSDQNARVQHARKISIDNVEYRIIQAYIPDSWNTVRDFLGKKQNVYKEFSNMLDESEVEGHYPNAVAFVADSNRSLMEKAAFWSYRTGNALVMSQQTAEDFGWSRSSMRKHFNMDGVNMVIVDPTYDAAQRAIAARKMKARITHADRDTIMPAYVDETDVLVFDDNGNPVLDDDGNQVRAGGKNGIYGVGDAEIRGFGRAGNIKYLDAKHTSRDVSDLLGRGTRRSYHIMSKEEIAQLVGNNNQIDAGTFERLKPRLFGTDIRPDVAYRKMAEFVNDLNAINENVDGIIKGGRGRGDVIAFVSDGKNFAPVFLPDNAVRTSEICGVELVGSTLRMYWSGEVGVGGQFDDRMKLAISGEAFKGELTMAGEDEQAPILIGCKRDNGEYESAVFVVSNETQSTRASNKEGIFLVRDLWYYTKYEGLLKGFSYIYDKISYQNGLKTNATLDVRSEIKELIKSRYGELTPDNARATKALNDFLYGSWDGVWGELLAGTLVYYTDGSEISNRRNNIMQKILSSCRRYGIDPRICFDATGVNFAEDYGKNTFMDTDFPIAFKDLTFDEVLLFYSGMDDRICAEGINDTQNDKAIKGKDQPAFNRFGKFKVEIPLPGQDGKSVTRYATVRWDVLNSIGDSSASRTAGYDAAYPWQHLYRRGLDYGYLDSEMEKMVNYSKFILGDPSFLQERTKLKVKEASERAQRAFGDFDESSLIENIKAHPNDSFAQIKHNTDQIKYRKGYTRFRNVTDNGTVVVNAYEDPRVKQEIAYLDEQVEFDKNVPILLLEMASKRIDGHTDLDNGVNDVSITRLASSIRDIAYNIKNYGLPVESKTEKARTSNERYALPELSIDEVDMWWACCKTIRDRWGTKEEFINQIHKASDKAKARLEYVEQSNPAKARALYTAFESDERAWGRFNPSESRYLYGGVYIFDLVNSRNELVDALMQGENYGEPIDVDNFNSLCDREVQLINDIHNIIEESDRFKNASMEVRDGKKYLYLTTKDDKTLAMVLNNGTELAQVMALMNPNVMLGNMLDRFIHQNITKASLYIGRTLHLGPYATTRVINQGLVRRAVNNPLFVKLYTAHRMAAFDGRELEMIASMSSPEQLSQWLDERNKNMTPYQKFCERIYGLSSGGNKFIKTQIENFINRFVMLAEEEGQDFWFQQATPDGVSYLEDALAKNPAKWFADVLGGNQGRTPSLTIALQAMNWAKTGDMAQRNVLSMMYENAVRNRPAAKFFMTTMVSRFPQYGLNITGRMLNWVMPISSINYVFTNMMAERGHRKAAESDSYIDPHYERAQIHRSLREAMLVDITHLGVTAVSAILVSMAGGIEPPEDEKKWGNIDEWTVCGVRVGEAWWIEDILGMALPSAAFTKAMMMGKPRFDILFNGSTQVMYNNPIIKVADVAGFLADPENRILTNYDKDFEAYKQARGGSPSVMEWVVMNGASLGLNWTTQFFTPSFVREMWNAAQEEEHSYKNIFEENQYGQLTEAGAAGEAVMRTTYRDAMLRRATRRNPILGWLFDLTLDPNTSYSATGMPNTRYLDDAQLAMAEKWSIEGLGPEESEAKLLEIVAVMQGYDDMEELRSTGFFLDYTTKAALSSLVHDIVHELDTWYNSLQSDGMFDYYAYGSFEEGQEAVAQIKQYYNSMKQYWTGFYYNKVRSAVLSEPMVSYNRYNTTYAEDVEGNVYATGFRPAGVFPFQNIMPFEAAPGQIGNPEGTAGWANDWATVSAVTGQPMDQRALIPASQSTSEWPSLDDWADDNNPNGYSKLYNEWHSVNTADEDGESGDHTGSLTGLPLANGTPSKSPKTTTTSGGGGGGYSSGGGSGGSGGGGYYPSIRSNWSTPNMSVPYGMGRVNLQDSKYSYLRPSFETKGSREAYRREDI